MTLLAIDNLSIRFHGTEAPTVKGISFTVEAGKTTAIVGESGSGKSITAQAILSLNPATTCPEGRILFQDRNLLEISEAGLCRVRGQDITMIFQEPMTALNPLHTVRKQLTEILTIHHPERGKEEVEKRIHELLDEVGLSYLSERLSHYPHQLSGGERQRVMIAMAIANHPALLIADEPTTALDVSTQSTIIALLQQLQQKHNMALLLITHDLHLVEHIADQVVVMQSGEVREQGSAERIFFQPEHGYTKALLAAQHATDPAPITQKAQELVSCRDLSVTYQRSQGLWAKQKEVTTALKPLTLSLTTGQTLGIVGESGSGKTTLGLALARLIASKGDILFEGRNISNQTGRQLLALRQRLQFVFQDPFSSLNPRMNIASIIGEGLNVHYPELTPQQRQQKIHTIMTRVGLEPDMAERYPHEFSGGQRQRISIARAMILEPACVIFDEPTSALDITLQTQIIALLKEFQQRQHISYVFISHDIQAIQSISHQVLVLKQGEVVERGRTQQIMEHPEHPYTQTLIAASQWL